MIVSIVLTSSVWRVRATSAAGGRTTATPSRRTTRTSSGLKQMPATSRPGNQRSSPASCRRPEYARAVMLANPAMISPGKLDNFLSVRRERQSRLEDGTGVRLDAVVWEAALLTTVGDTSIQKAQLEHLANLTKRPNISVQVLPLEAGDHASMSGSFVLFSFGSNPAVSTVFVEHLTSSQYLEQEDELLGYTLVFDTLRSAALSTEESAARLDRHAPERQARG